MSFYSLQNSNYNCQPDLVFQSETNYIEHLGNVQQAFLIVSNTNKTDNNTIEDIASLQHCLMVEAQPISISAEDLIPEPINEHALIKMKNISIKQIWLDRSIAESLLKENIFHSTSCLMPMKLSLQQDLYTKPN